MSNKEEPLFISLGTQCETAFQIKRYTRNNEAYFFDWLITRKDSYKSLFLNNNEIFKSNNWEISKDCLKVEDLSTKLLFQHEFKVINNTSNHIDPGSIENHLPSASAKFIYLKNKTLNAIKNTDNVYLVRKENFDNIELAWNRIRHIHELFSPLNKNINIILTSNRIKEEVMKGRFLIVKNKISSSWEGSNESWNRVFKLALAHGSESEFLTSNIK